ISVPALPYSHNPTCDGSIFDNTNSPSCQQYSLTSQAEESYLITPTQAGEVNVYFSGNVTAVLYQGAPSGCEIPPTAACVDTSTTGSLSFCAQAGQDYTLVIEERISSGWGQCGTIEITQVGAPTLTPIVALPHSEGPGNMTNAIDFYRTPRVPACGQMGGPMGGGMTAAPEKGWVFTAPADGEITVTLTSNDLMALFVYEGEIGNPCNGTLPVLECKGMGRTDFAPNATVTLCVTANTKYYIFIESGLFNPNPNPSYSSLLVSSVSSSPNCSGTSLGKRHDKPQIEVQAQQSHLLIRCLNGGAGNLSKVSLYDGSGRLVYTGEMRDELRIDGSSWSSGLYHVVVQGEGWSISRPILWER
ncbi:MAG: T9SS type A sorting domain-containing protein, partial [Bacteroidia bacterium]|nr:T9SS type A sorting domain-containing protein [Bacteroidia bacterium]